jgi:Tfp pilus assembly protein PilF
MKKLLLLILSMMLMATIGCSQKSRKSESVLDSPSMHISRGMKYFDNEEYEKAKKEFDDAILIKWEEEEEKAGAYAGLGMYFAVKGNEDKAIDNAKEGVSLDKKNPLVFTSFGRTIMFLNKGKDGDEWIEDSFEKFDEAIEIAKETEPRDIKAMAMAYFFKGIAAKTAYKFRDAVQSFKEVIELRSSYATEANEQWEIVQMIERAKPGTKVGAKVALMDKVGNAEIAILFIEELKVNELIKKKEKKSYDTDFKAPEDPMKYEADKMVKAEKATDIKNHWAKSWINDVLSTGVMETAPDHTFNPDTKITRAEYSMMLLRVLVMVTGDESLYTKYFGEENSRFNDLRTSHPAYNAAAVCVNRGIMKMYDKIRAEFGATETVSGAEALLIIRDFQNALTMTF